MDLSNIVAVGRTVDILHPKTKEPVGLKVDLLPDTDEKVEAARRKIQNRRLASRSIKVTAEQMDAEGIELLSAAITGWEWCGELTFRGEKPECTPENVRRVLKALPWVKKQIDEESGYTEAFFEG